MNFLSVLFQRFFFDQTQIESDNDSLSRTVPVPEQRGRRDGWIHPVMGSDADGTFPAAKARNMADLNTRPVLTHRFTRRFSTARWWRTGVMSMKSIKSGRRGHAGAADEQSHRQLRVGVKRGFFDIAAAGRACGVESMAVNASVLSITMEPPDGRQLHAGRRTQSATQSGSG